MITRAAGLLGLAWMCLPHHPDLGLPRNACAGPACILPAAETEREAILRRLREVRREILATKSGGLVAQLPAPPSGNRR